MLHPVILVLDNDSGLDSVAGTIKKTFGVRITTASTADYYHVTDNLYLVKTPEGSKLPCIEGLFPTKLTATILKGKKFSPASKIDPSKEYGKEVFANSVVRPSAASIDFSGFDPLLERIAKVLLHYKPPGLFDAASLPPASAAQKTG